jgi:hypothetical protein
MAPENKISLKMLDSKNGLKNRPKAVFTCRNIDKNSLQTEKPLHSAFRMALNYEFSN